MKKPIIKYALIILLILTAAWFRLYRLAGPEQTPPGLFSDEAMNGLDVLESIETGHMKIFYERNVGREGLFINIQGLFVRALDTYDPWVLRFPSAIFGILTVLLFYFLLLELFYKTPRRHLIAFYSAFLMAILPWHITFSRIGFRAILAPLLLILTVTLLFKALRKIKENKKYLSLFFAAGLIYGLGFHTYIAYRITPLIIISIFWAYTYFYKIPWKNLTKQIIAFSSGAILTILPIALYFVNNPEYFFKRIGEVTIFQDPNWAWLMIKNFCLQISMIFFSGDKVPRFNYGQMPELTPLMTIFTIIALIYFFNKKTLKTAKLINETEIKLAFILSFIWVFIAMLPAVLSDQDMPHSLRSILTIPPILIITGVGLYIALEYLKNITKNSKPKIITVTIIIFFGLTIFSYNQYFILYAHSPFTASTFNNDCLNIVDKIKMQPINTKKYIVTPSQEKIDRGGCTSIIMFITNTYSKQNQKTKNMYYKNAIEFLEEKNINPADEIYPLNY